MRHPADRLLYLRRRLARRQTVLRFISVLLAANVVAAAINWVLVGPGWTLVGWEARRRVARALGPAPFYDVSVRASWADLLRGDVPSQLIRARDVRLKKMMTVASLEIWIRGLSIRGSEITRLDSVLFRASLDEAGLNQYLAERPHLRLNTDLHLTLRSGRIEVDGSIPLTHIPFHVVGRLEVRNQTQLWLIVDQAHVVILPIGDYVRRLVRLINPVVSLEDFPFGLRLTSFDIEEGRLDFVGTASPRLPMPLAPPRPDGGS